MGHRIERDERLARRNAQVAQTAGHMQREDARQQRASGHDAAAAALSALSQEAASYLALRVQEATAGAPTAFQRMLGALKELGMHIPPGFLP